MSHALALFSSTTSDAGGWNDGAQGEAQDGTEFPADLDTAAYAAGYVTIAPLQTDWTAQKSIKALKKWDIELPAP